MDLSSTYPTGHNYKLYEKRLYLSLCMAIVFHLALGWYLSQQARTTMPDLPDWVQVKLVAGLETAERITQDKPQQAVVQKKIINTRPAAKTEQVEKVTTPATPSQARDSVQTRQQPRLLDNPRPVYPAAAKRRGMQGTVLLELEVSARGKVTKVQLKKSSGYRVLDIAAMNSVTLWQFVPAQDEDEKIASVVEIPVRFELQNL